MVGIPQFVGKILLHFIVLSRKTNLIYVDMVHKVWESSQCVFGGPFFCCSATCCLLEG